MAGVTFLAFGNGSPDVFSTFAAMSTHSGSMAVGELIGAAGFITAVVAGSMALVRPFRVARKSFVRDVGFFIVASSFSMIFLADGHLHFWECAVMVAFYVFYVVTVVIWHWVLGHRRRRKDREIAARSQFIVTDEDDIATEQSSSSLFHQSRSRGASRGTIVDDFAALEAGGSAFEVEDADQNEDDETRDRWMAEISSNMRLKRPLIGDRRKTANPIRPSLVGALEFRAVLSSLNKVRNHQNSLISLRRYSDDPTCTLAQHQHTFSTGSAPRPGASPVDAHTVVARDARRLSIQREHDANRVRAVSANDASRLHMGSFAIRAATIPQTDLLGPTPPGTADLSIPSFSGTNRAGENRGSLSEPLSPSVLVSAPIELGNQASSLLHSPNGPLSQHLASPQDEAPDSTGVYQRSVIAEGYFTNLPERSTALGSRLLPGTACSSPATPFPPYHDDPNLVPSISRVPSIRLSPPNMTCEPQFPAQAYNDLPQKPIRGWPHSVLPQPKVLASTLFPTLYSWRDKSIGEKILGVVAAPSVFLLAITLPVVENEKGEDDEPPDPFNQGSSLLAPGDLVSSSSFHTTVVSSPKDNDHKVAYRDSENVDRESTSSSHNENQVDADAMENNAVDHNHPASRLAAHNDQIGPRANSSLNADGHSIRPSKPPPSSPEDWNRWLVSTQIFTAPFFVVLVVWANSDPNLSIRNLLRSGLYTLVGSLVLFAFMLMTTSAFRPPKYRYFLCFLGFVVSIAWISTIANEVVGVLKAIGVILGISDAILGLTIFAVGNSLGDLVADITVARLGYPVMALSACFGGPMLNILLGIGLSGLYMTVRDSNGRHDRHPDQSMKYKPYQIEVHGTLIISGIALLITLVGLLVVVPLNKWVMDRRIGWGLVILWCISTIGNLVVESTGWSGGHG